MVRVAGQQDEGSGGGNEGGWQGSWRRVAVVDGHREAWSVASGMGSVWDGLNRKKN